MPRYAESAYDYRYAELVRWNGGVYGVLEDAEEDITVRLVTTEAIRTVGEDYDALKEASVVAPVRQVQLIDPVKPAPGQVRALFRLDAMPWELLEQGQYAYAKKYNTSDIWLLYPYNREMEKYSELMFKSKDNVNVRINYIKVADIKSSMDVLLSRLTS